MGGQPASLLASRPAVRVGESIHVYIYIYIYIYIYEPADTSDVLCGRFGVRVACADAAISTGDLDVSVFGRPWF